MTEQEILEQIELIRNKPTRSIYDFNKLRKLEQQLEKEKSNEAQSKEIKG